jgi:indole-3-pyruvate monooxygenase
MMVSTNTLIIGAGPAGLASAACMEKRGLEYLVVDKEAGPASSWRNHYDRLHLHTSKKRSALPFLEFGAQVPKYPSRQQVVNYLSQYAIRFDIRARYKTAVHKLEYVGQRWIARTDDEPIEANSVILASGLNQQPLVPGLEGLDSFPGRVLHSSEYRNGSPFKGKKVLVVGFGNSACEQALCLVEHGAKTALSVRSAVNVLPRDIMGISVLEIGRLTSIFPPRLADKINAPLLRLMVGDLAKLGLKKSRLGPMEQIAKMKRIPLLDTGTIDQIRKGHIEVYGKIEKVRGSLVRFEDGRQAEFDAIILATGYQHGLRHFLAVDNERMEDMSREISSQRFFGKDGLYACGFYLSPRGMLHEIGIEAKAIANDIAHKRRR